MANKNKRPFIQNLGSPVGQKMLNDQLDWVWGQLMGRLPEKALSPALQGTINSKATQADLDETDGRVTTLSTEIIQAANTIRLAAGQTETDDLGTALVTVMSEIILTPGRITAEVTNGNVHVGFSPPVGDGLYEGRLWQNKLTGEQLRWKDIVANTARSYAVTNSTPTVRIDDLSDDLEIAVTTAAGATVTLTKTNLIKKGVTVTASGVTLTFADDGTIAVTGTCSAAAGSPVVFQIQMGYYLSGQHTFSAGNAVAYGADLQLRLLSAAGTQVVSPSTNFGVSTIGAKLTFTLSNQMVWGYGIRVQGGVTYNATLKPQLEKAADATAYEAPDHVVYTADAAGEVAVIGRDGVNCIVSSALSLSAAYTGSGWALVSANARKVYASSSFTIDETGATVHHILLDGVTPYEAYTRLYGGGLEIYEESTGDFIGGLCIRGGRLVLSASAVTDPRVSSDFMVDVFTEDDTYLSEPITRFGMRFKKGSVDYGGIGVEKNAAGGAYYNTLFVGRGGKRVTISTKEDGVVETGATMRIGGFGGMGYVSLEAMVASGGVVTGRAAIGLDAALQQITTYGHIIPSNDNTWDCGSATNRVKKYYGASSTISTSDEREKHDIHSADPEMMQKFLMALDVDWFRLNGLPNELMVGFIAQKFREAMRKAGMPDDFGGYVDELPDHSRLALRYEQIIAPIVSVVQQQQHRIDELERKLNALTNDLK